MPKQTIKLGEYNGIKCFRYSLCGFICGG